MPAGKHGSAELTFSYDDGPGGTPRTMTAYLMTIGAIKLTSNMQGSTAYGDTLEKQLPTGMSKIDPITVHGLFDDTATTGPHTVFGTPDTSPQAATRTLAIVVGNGKTWTSEGYCQSYSVIAKNGNLTEYEAVLIQNSGAWS